MKYIIDANIIFSALYKMESNAGRLLLMAIDDEVDLISTEHIEDELKRITRDKLHFSDEEIVEILGSLPVKWFEREIYADGMNDAMKKISDEGDASLLALAALSGYEIITGDREILLTDFKDVKIRRLKEAIDI